MIETMRRRKLAVITTHPIQYYAPVFRELASGGARAADTALDLKVFYTWSQSADSELFDAGFGAAVAWDVPLLAGYAYEFVPNVAADPGVHHFRGLQNPELVKAIEAWGADAVLIIGWSHHSHLRALRHFKGRIPVFFRGDSTLLDERSWWRSALRRGFLRWVYSHVDMAIAVGANSRDYFSWCGLPDARIAVAPHCVDTVRFGADGAARDAQAAEWRLSLGIPREAVVFLFAGKFQRKKSPDTLLAAFRRLGGAAHLVFVGSGELEAELKAETELKPQEALNAEADRNVHAELTAEPALDAEADLNALAEIRPLQVAVSEAGHNAKLGPTALVHFLPFQNQSVMPLVYRLGDVFVLPSRGPGETWGLALNEAMACGRAVMASTKVGGARDLIRPGETGWVFAADDVAALGAALRAAAALGRAGLAAVGHAGRQRIAGWTTEESARRIAEIVGASRGP